MSLQTETRQTPKSKRTNEPGRARLARKPATAVERQDRWTFLGLSAPSVLMLVLIYAYPVAYAFYQSVHDGNLINAGEFIGADNYIANLQSETFWHAAVFTALFTIVGVFGSWIVGLGLAMLLQAKVPGRSVFKVLLLLPWVVPIAVSAMSWNWLVGTPNSPVPMLITWMGFDAPHFLADPVLAAIMVFLFKIWVSFPFMMLMSSAALSSVDPTVYEASTVDGANKFQQFWSITLPLIRPSTYISWVLMVIFCVNDFPTIYLLTNGGPVSATTSLVVLAYTEVFLNNQVGSGVAVAFLTTTVLVIVSVVLYRVIRKSSVAE